MIFVECNPDFLLVQAFNLFDRKEIIHAAQGKGAICRALSNKSNCLALLDEDPGNPQPPYITRLTVQADIERHDIKILRDSLRNNFVIILIPKLEDWIIRAARLSNLDMRDYNLPNNERELHRIINYRLDKYAILLSDLGKNRSAMLVSLSAALRQQPG